MGINFRAAGQKTFSDLGYNTAFFNAKTTSGNQAKMKPALNTDVYDGKKDKQRLMTAGAAIAVIGSVGALFGFAVKGKNINKFALNVPDEKLGLWSNIQEGFKYTVSKVKSLWNSSEKIKCDDINDKIKAGKEALCAKNTPANKDNIQQEIKAGVQNEPPATNNPPKPKSPGTEPPETGNPPEIEPPKTDSLPHAPAAKKKHNSTKRKTKTETPGIQPERKVQNNPAVKNKQEPKKQPDQKPVAPASKDDTVTPKVETVKPKTPEELYKAELAKMEQIGRQNKKLTDAQIADYAKTMSVSAGECSVKADETIATVNEIFANKGLDRSGKKVADIENISPVMTVMTDEYTANGQTIKRTCRIKNGVLREIKETLPNGERYREITMGANGAKQSYDEGFTTFETGRVKVAKTARFDTETGNIDSYGEENLISLFSGIFDKFLQFKDGKPVKIGVFSGEYGKNKTPEYIEKLI